MAAFPALLTFSGITPVSPEQYEIGAGSFKPNTFIGSGPYKLDSWKQGGSNVDFSAINVGWDLEAGTAYTLQISGRSNGTEIDRIALSNDGASNANALANDGAVSAVQGGGGGTGGVRGRRGIACGCGIGP